MPPRRVVLIGATGFTGELVARRLAVEGIRSALLGRDPARLASLSSQLGGSETHQIDVSNGARLAGLLHPGDVVINCAGPFSRLGEPVVRACVGARAHYLDTTGEQRFMKRIEDVFHRPACEAGVAVVNSMAFEFAIGDCLARILAARHGDRLRSVDVFYSWPGGSAGSSRGTRRSTLEVVRDGGYAFERGRLREREVGAERRKVRLADGESRTAAWFPAGESLTVPRHVIVERVSGWMVLGRSLGFLLPALSPALPTLARLAGPAAEWWIRRSPDGPEASVRAKSRFRIEVHARTFQGGAVGGFAEGVDPYALTAAIVVEGARALLASVSRTGVLAPAQLVAPERLLDSLRGDSLRWAVPCTGRGPDV